MLLPACSRTSKAEPLQSESSSRHECTGRMQASLGWQQKSNVGDVIQKHVMYQAVHESIEPASSDKWPVGTRP